MAMPPTIIFLVFIEWRTEMPFEIVPSVAVGLLGICQKSDTLHS